MKIIFKISIVLNILFSVSYGQAPESFNFQAIARDASGAVMNDESISFKAYILEGSPSGNQVYGETHIVMTDQYGHFSLAVGQGSAFLGDMSTVNWGANNYYLSTELNGVNMGSSQLLSVPYALHAKSIEGGSGTIDSDSTNELQTISKVGNTVTLSNGGGSFTDSVNTYAGGPGILINNNIIVASDVSNTNELQTITKTGNTVTLSNGGGSFTDAVNTYSAGPGIDITNNVISTVGPTIVAAARVSSSGVSLKGHNISAISKASTGYYKVYLTNPIDANSLVMVTNNGTSGASSIYNAAARIENSSEIWVYTGYESRFDDGSTFDDDHVYRITPADLSFSLIVYDL
jgi:hypothetical protein